MYGLGELPYWRSWSVSLHLRRCAACRERQKSLKRASSAMAVALRPPVGGPRAGKPPVSALHGWLTIAAIVTFLAATFFTARYVAVAYWRSHTLREDIPCRPDLPNDKCR